MVLLSCGDDGADLEGVVVRVVRGENQSSDVMRPDI